MTEFINVTYEKNILFKSVELYLKKCPYFKEILTSMALTHFHILRPYLIAVGTDNEGSNFKQLSYKALCTFYSKLNDQLRDLSMDVSSLLSQETLPYLKEFKELGNISEKYKQKLFYRIFSKIVPECNMDILKNALIVIIEKYWTVFAKETTGVYIGTNSKIPELLAKDPTYLDGVPTNALAIEHSVGMIRAAEKVAPQSSITRQGNLQIVGQSPWMEDLVHQTGFEEAVKFTSASDNIKFYRKLREAMKSKQLQLRYESLEKLCDKRDNHEKRKGELASQIEEYGGPLKAGSEVDTLIASGDERAISRVLNINILYQKHVINDKTHTEKLYKMRKKQPDNTLPLLPIETRAENLKILLKPAGIISTNTNNCPPPIDSIVTKIKESLESFKQYNIQREL